MLKRLVPLAALLLFATAVFAQAASAEAPQTALAGAGVLWTLLGAFVAGIGVSFTPCVYPMIPITLSIIGARSVEQRPLVGFMRSLIFVLGIALIYSALGYGAAMSGRTLGFVFQNKWFIFAIALFFIAMGLSMLDLFTIQMPATLAGRLQGGASRGGYVGAFLLGIVTGVVASPCGSPVLATALAFAVESGQAAVGVSMLFTYALGLGMLFLVLGTFPSFLKAVPKSGMWMDDIKKFMGLVLVGVGIFYLGRRPAVLPPLAYWGVVLGASLVGALALAVKSGSRRRHPKLLVAWNAAAALLAIFAVYVAVAKIPPAIMKADASVMSSAKAVAEAKQALRNLQASDAIAAMQPVAGTSGATQTQASAPATTEGAAQAAPPQPPAGSDEWLSDEDEALALAKAGRRPLIIDFGAEWCAACKELEHKTFPNPEVKKALSNFVKLRIDATEETEQNQAQQKKYGARSLPTVVFFDKDGKALPELTLYTFEPPQKFLERLKKVPQ